jgi:hypothetical protein
LKANESVSARLSELQAEAAKDTAVTVESLLCELEHARSKATDNNQLAAATTAIMGKAKLAGFLRDKVEITTVDEFNDDEMSIEDIAAVLARHQCEGYELTPEQRTEFAAFMVSWVQAMNEYLAGCVAKPVQPMADIERRRLGLIGNGNQRRLSNGSRSTT